MCLIQLHIDPYLPTTIQQLAKFFLEKQKKVVDFVLHNAAKEGSPTILYVCMQATKNSALNAGLVTATKSERGAERKNI